VMYPSEVLMDVLSFLYVKYILDSRGRSIQIFDTLYASGRTSMLASLDDRGIIIAF